MIWQQFNDIHKVYVYNADWQLRGAAPNREQPIMEPQDMGDSTAQVPNTYDNAAACVVPSLASLGRPVPGQQGAGTSQAHHAYSVGQGIDYRTDSDYLRLYVQHYNLQLIHSGPVAWNAVPWVNLGGAGDYLATTYVNPPGGTVKCF